MLKAFDKNLIPIGVLPDAYDVQRNRRLNSDYELSFLLPMTSDDYTQKILQKGHVQDEKGQYYVINSRKRIREGLKRTVMIECSHIMFKLADFKMPYNSYIEESYGTNISVLTNLISLATGGKFTISIDDTFDPKDIKDFGRGNVLQALNFVIKTYGCEVEPDNFIIHLKKKIGADNGMQYRFKKNTMGTNFKDDVRALVTRMYAQMKDGLSFINLPASNLTPEEYNLLNAIPGAIVGGLIKVNYLISPYAASWSNSTNTYYDGELINQDLEDPKELLEATRKALQEQEVPALEVTINAADLYKIDNTELRPNMGDTVYLIDPELDLNNITARIVDITEYPYAPDKHTQVTLANYMLRDYDDIIADLDRSKRIVDDLISGGKVRTTAFEAFAKQAVIDINNSKSEVLYDQRGIVLQDKTNAQNQVIMTANGIIITKDGGTTANTAITGNGIAAKYIVGILGEFAQVKTDNLIAGNAKITSAMISSINANQINVGTLTGFTLIGGLIKTADTSYPRIELSGVGNLLKAMATNSQEINITPNTNGDPAIVFSNSGKKGIVQMDGNYLYILTGAGLTISINSGSDIELFPNNNVVFQSWSKIWNNGSSRSLQQEISSLQSQINGKAGSFSGHSGMISYVKSVDFANQSYGVGFLNVNNGIITGTLG